MSEEKNFVYEKLIEAPAELIYRAFTSATALREWLCDISTTNPEEGGRIYLAWSRGYFASGSFTKLVPNQTVSFTWIGKDEPAWSQVEVTIEPVDELTQKVILRHTGLGEGAAWQNARAEIDKGWKIGLENLQSTLETGYDLRVVDRPLIGIYPEDLAPQKQKELGIPVCYGVRVSEVIPGYGAEKAGIQPNDVIVAVNGQKIEKIRSLAPVMAEHKNGDQLLVDVYRGREKKSFSIETKLQKMEDLPDSPEELAKEIEARTSKALESLDQVLENVSEPEASYSPGPDEWSIKEILVHLIHTERDLHIWINDLVAGKERFYDEWPGEKLFRIRATLAAYPTVNDLVAELRRSLKITVAAVAFLDPKFTERKISYWRLGMELLGMPAHIQDHIRQIEDNLRAAHSGIID